MNDLIENGPRWKAGDYIIVEHLTMEDLERMGETPSSDGVVRMSLADDNKGSNAKKLVELAISIEDRELITKALLKLSDWGHGFVLASNLRNEGVGLICHPPKTPHVFGD